MWLLNFRCKYKEIKKSKHKYTKTLLLLNANALKQSRHIKLKQKNIVVQLLLYNKSIYSSSSVYFFLIFLYEIYLTTQL